MSVTSPFAVAVDEPSLLGESPIWSADEQALYWVDIVAPALKRFDPATGMVTSVPMPEEIGCIGFSACGGTVAAFRSGIWLLDSRGRRLRQIAANPEDTSRSRFNDGRVDQRGRLWVGTLDESGGNGANLYCLDGDRLERIDTGLSISNGLAFSPDGCFAYHSDTPTRLIYRRTIEPTSGHIGRRETWLDIDRRPADPSRPDGAAVDCEGFYWVALYEGGRIERYASDGRCVGRFPVPALCPTMVCHGGPDLRTLYVTTARHERSAGELARWPLSGAVFAMQVEVAGMPTHQFVEPPMDAATPRL